MALQDILQSKKILLFSVSFFNYEKIIAERLKELGADVDFMMSDLLIQFCQRIDPTKASYIKYKLINILKGF